jgi:anti-sigma regulatory factor (Ser/Thr protein kinase)
VIEAPALGPRLELELPVEPESLGLVRTHLRRWLREQGAEHSVIQDILVASGEAISNVIEHAYGPGRATFRVEAELTSPGATVTVRDFGRWRETSREIGHGRGTGLIHALMDDVSIATGEGGTVVRMVRALHGDPGTQDVAA